jgi:RNA polymerase sigma-70 factor (ECF subfamily)
MFRVKNTSADPKELIRLAKSGDEKAFGQLYELYYVPVYRYIYLRIGRREETEDLLQIVFLKVYQALPRYQERGYTPLAYFLTVARNAITDHFRAQKNLVRPDNLMRTLESLPSSEDLEEGVEKKEEDLILHQAIEQLPETQQEVVILKFINGFSNAEISRMLGKTEVAVRQIQHRALQLLRKKMVNLGVSNV